MDNSYELFACRRLLFAILERGILDLALPVASRRGRQVRPLEYDTALRWIEPRHFKERIECNGKQIVKVHKGRRITDYHRICEVLNIDPNWLRNPKRRAKICRYFLKKQDEVKRNVPE